LKNRLANSEPSTGTSRTSGDVRLESAKEAGQTAVTG
jgi:hypothetical protein